MYRDDQNAMALRLEQLSKTEETNQAMREELLELRRALATQPTGNPYSPMARFGPGERAALAEHSLEAFPVWAVGLLHFFTFGLFSIIWFGIQQGRLPRAAHNDPTTGKAIGYQFIPFFNYYWMFFNPLRLCERLALQFRLRKIDDGGPYALCLASSILSVIPYLGIISIPILWTVASCILQSKINKLVALGPLQLAGDVSSDDPRRQLLP